MNKFIKLLFLPVTPLFLRVTLMFLLVACMGYAQSSKNINSVKQLTDSIRIIVKERHIPGLMLGIATKDSVVYAGGFGYADVKSKKEVNSQTLFRMGSITKSLIAIAILQLTEQGRLSLNDNLKKIAPEVPFSNQWENSNAVKVVNLLENTTGFDDFKLNKMYTLDRRYYNSAEMMELQKNSMVCRWRPSERYTYCNVNYVILGYLIKKITGKEYDEYLRENILLPLHMTASNFNTWPKTGGNTIKEYLISSGQTIEVPSVTLLPAAAGSLWSCSDDMIKLLQFYLKDGYPILQRASLKRMETPVSSLAAAAGLKSGYALGNFDDGRFRGHDGLLGTCRSVYKYSQKLGYGYVIAANGGGIGKIEELVKQYLTRNVIAEKPDSVVFDQKAILPYLGYYQAEDPRFDILALTDRLMLLKIEVRHGKLVMNIMGRRHTLIQTAPFTFTRQGETIPGIVFAVNAAGKRVLIIDKHYCEQVNTFTAIGKRAGLMIAVLITALYMPVGLIVFAFFLWKKAGYRELLMIALPIISMTFLIWGVYNFMEVKDNSYLLYELREVSPRSVAIFIGITLFALLAVLNMFMLLRYQSIDIKLFMKIGLMLVGVCLVVIALFLFVNGWVGLKSWTM